MQATRAVVRLDRFRGNFKAIRERVGPRRLICVPVKADAYGHGAAAISRASLDAGAAFLGVARLDEGAELRKEGIDAPILLFSQGMPEEIPGIIENNLIPFVSDGEFAALLGRAARSAGITVPVHLKIDTGMGRMGCPPAEAAALAGQIAACAGLALAGTATHLAAADSAAPGDVAYTGRQIALFRAALDEMRAAGLNPGIAHAANSGAVALHPGAWFDMVRPGILLYGYQSAAEADAGLPLPPLRVEPVMELRTKVAMIKRVKKGEAVSYGRTWAAPRDTEIAVLPVGYGDGLPRLLSNKWQAAIGGREYPLVGRICMDQCMADIGPVSGGPGARPRRWDEAVIFGGPAPDAAALALCAGTIPYEITCGISKRVPRVYCTQ